MRVLGTAIVVGISLVLTGDVTFARGLKRGGGGHPHIGGGQHRGGGGGGFAKGEHREMPHPSGKAIAGGGGAAHHGGSSFQLPSNTRHGGGGSAHQIKRPHEGGGGGARLGGDAASRGPIRRENPADPNRGHLRPGGDAPSRGPIRPDGGGIRPGSDAASRGPLRPDSGVRPGSDLPSRGPLRPDSGGVRPGSDRPSQGPLRPENDRFRPGNNDVRPGGDRASWGPKNRFENAFPNGLDPRRRNGVRPGSDRASWGPNNRRDYWNDFRKDHQAQIDQFKNRRDNDWNQINDNRRRNNHNNYNSPTYKNYRNQVNNFWDNRSLEVKNDIDVDCDHLFSDGWWSDHPWATFGAGVATGATATNLAYWWWRPTTYASVTSFLPWGWPPEPPTYDYGVNVVYEGDNVYVNGQPAGSSTQYTKIAIDLAHRNESAPLPQPAADPAAASVPAWMPLGVWALAPEEKGEASIFFQLSVDKGGVISGAYSNVMSGEEAPIVGQVDRESKRAAWHIQNNSRTVFEAGLPNLTKEVAACLVHYGTDSTQNWLLVRLPNPEMPAAPTALPEEPKR